MPGGWTYFDGVARITGNLVATCSLERVPYRPRCSGFDDICQGRWLSAVTDCRRDRRGAAVRRVAPRGDQQSRTVDVSRDSTVGQTLEDLNLLVLGFCAGAYWGLSQA